MNSSGWADKVDDNIYPSLAGFQRPLYDVLLMILLIPMDDVIAIVIQGSQEFVNAVVRHKQFDVGLAELGQHVVG